MNVPENPTTSTERVAVRISSDQTIKSELIPSPLSTGLVSNHRRVLRSSSTRSLRYQRRTSVIATAAYPDITTNVQMPSSIRITAIANGDSNNNKSNDRPKKRKSAGAGTASGTDVLTNAQCIVSDDDESILNKKKKKRNNNINVNTNTNTNTTNPSPTTICTKNVGKCIRSSVSSTSSSSSSPSSSLITQAQIHSKKYPFPHKLYDLIADVISSGSTDVISWSDDGTEFIVHDHARFASEILPTYFGHQQMRSFDRQLNYWEFEKTNRTKITNKSFGGKSWKHPSFQKDRRDLLKNVVRKKIKNGPASTRRYTFNDGDEKKNKNKNTTAKKIDKKQRMEEVLESILPGPTHANVRKNMLLKIQSTNIINPVVNQESSSSSTTSSSSLKESLQPLPESKLAAPTELRRNINLVVNQESPSSSTSSSKSSSLSSSSQEEEESLPPLPEYVRTSSDMIATALYEEANNDIEYAFLPLLPIDCFNDVDGDGDDDYKDKNEDENNKHNITNNTDGGMVYQWDDNNIVFGGKSFHDVKLGGNDNDNNDNNVDDDDDDDDDDDEAMSTLMSIILKDEEESPLLTYKDDINEINSSSFLCLFDLTATATTSVH
jgi:hypothetical protein